MLNPLAGNRRKKHSNTINQHQKFKKKVPFAVWLLIVILGFMAWKGFNLYQIYQKNTGQVEQAEESTANSEMVQAVEQAASQENTQGRMTQDLKPEDFVPKLAEKPESKPIYNGVRQVKTFEYIAGCVDGGKSGCTCYSSQGTPLKEITKAMCKDYAKNGLPFNPYKDEQQTAQQPQTAPQTAYEPENSQVITMGGKSPQNLMYDGYVEAGQQFAQRGGVVGTP